MGSTMITVDDINEAWGWVGLTAVEVLGANAFGNLIIRDADGSYWRLRPQDLCCESLRNSAGSMPRPARIHRLDDDQQNWTFGSTIG